MKWSTAYNFNLQRDVGINEVMELRRLHGRNDPRAGALWCHKNCHDTETGFKISSRKESVSLETGLITKRAHFAQWKSKHINKGSSCEVYSLAESKRESMDYANYYKQFESYLNTLVDQKEPYFISGFEKFDSEGLPDFRIQHSTIFNDKIDKTEIHIVDENKRKKRLFPASKIERGTFVIVIHISEYTPEQLADFEVGGIEHFRVKWNNCMNMLEDLIKKDMLLAEEERIEKIQEIESRRKSEEINRIKSEIRNLIEKISSQVFDNINQSIREKKPYLEAIEYINNDGDVLISERDWDKAYSRLKTLIDRFHKLQVNRRSGAHIITSKHHAGLPEGNVVEQGFSMLTELLDDKWNILHPEGFDPEEYHTNNWDWDRILKFTNAEIMNAAATNLSNEIDEIFSELANKRSSHFSEFRTKHDPESHIENLRNKVDQRIEYFDKWLKVYKFTEHKQQISSTGKIKVEKLRDECKEFLNSKTLDEQILLYHKNGFKTQEEFINKFLNGNIFSGVEQGHRMMRITKSEWTELSSDQRMEIKDNVLDSIK